MSRIFARIRMSPVISGVVAELAFAAALGLVGCLIGAAVFLLVGAP